MKKRINRCTVCYLILIVFYFSFVTIIQVKTHETWNIYEKDIWGLQNSVKTTEATSNNHYYELIKSLMT